MSPSQPPRAGRPSAVPPRPAGSSPSSAQRWAPPRTDTRFHVLAAVALLVGGGVLFGLWSGVTTRQPARGHTVLGYALGTVAGLFYVFATLYSWRKRAGQEWMPGRLQTWLRLHLWLSLGGLLAALLHAGFHVDGGLGTWTLALLVVTLGSGIVGWWFYCRVPLVVAATDVGLRDGEGRPIPFGNLATKGTRTRVEAIEQEIAALSTGKSEALKAQASALLGRGRGGPAPKGPLATGELPTLDRVKALAAERDGLLAGLVEQGRLRRWLRTWLWVHVPAAILFLPTMLVHAWDASEAGWTFTTPTPRDFADPLTCRECHRRQYDEWILSPHAMAQSSPVMDLQNRLVLLAQFTEERTPARRGRAWRQDLPSPIPVKDLCTRCHAPTGSLPQMAPSSHESPLAEIEDRAPASRYGISCVTCHQITEVHPHAISASPSGQPYRDLENLVWTQGKRYLGSLGGPGELPSIGNAAHRGAFAAIFVDHDPRRAQERGVDYRTQAHLCASCHTVTVDRPHDPASPHLKLQDTWQEWLDGGKGPGAVNWSERGLGCMSCHNMDLSSAAKLATSLAQKDREEGLALTPDVLRARIAKMEAELRGLQLVGETSRSAEGSFDLPLPAGRRRFLHTFTGIDTPMEEGVPYLAGHPEADKVPNARATAIARTGNLLRIAAAIGIERWPDDGVLKVNVASLATGHKLPAGFAFAREMWLEVSVQGRSDRPEDDAAWFRIVGGAGGGAGLPSSARLLKRDPITGGDVGLRNLQAVLHDGKTSVDAVLQNETFTVLKGEKAVKAGFPDRVDALLPGDVREVKIPLALLGEHGARVARAARLRVRLLCRNLPPEFLEGLAVRFDDLGDVARAARARRLSDHLVIHEMAVDVLER